jgi:DNA-directed RNA polymerase subunit RPC12/RpoP
MVVWTEGQKSPTDEVADEEYRSSPARLAELRLPDQFSIYVDCEHCGYGWKGVGTCEDETWVRTDWDLDISVDLVEARIIEADLRQCSNCWDAWQFPIEGAYAVCPTCGAMTCLATG